MKRLDSAELQMCIRDRSDTKKMNIPFGPVLPLISSMPES